jgi:hypothetical protein
MHVIAFKFMTHHVLCIALCARTCLVPPRKFKYWLFSAGSEAIGRSILILESAGFLLIKISCCFVAPYLYASSSCRFCHNLDVVPVRNDDTDVPPLLNSLRYARARELVCLETSGRVYAKVSLVASSWVFAAARARRLCRIPLAV